MSNVIQNYQFNEDFQLCSVQQLNAASNNEYKWQGRKVVSWFDDDGNTYEVAGIANFGSKPKASISARWELSDFNVNVDFKTSHGKVVVTTSCDEMPLPAAGIMRSVELSSGSQTSSSILYNSLLSIDAIPENDEYETTLFDVNGEGQVLSDQYIYKNNSTNDKTGANKFNVAVGFNTNLDVAGVSVFIIDGSATRVPYSTLPDNTLQMFGSDGNPVSPFNSYAKMETLSVMGVIDPYSLVSAIGNSSFYNCTNLSSIECSNALSIGNNAFYQCYGLPSAHFPNAEIIGDNAFFRCNSLTSIECSNVISIGIAAFNDGGSPGYEVKIQTIDIPNAICIGGAAFNGCKELHDANLENVLSIFGSNGTAYQRYHGAFSRCIKLSSVKAPKAIYIEREAFNECSNLSSIDLPSANTLGDRSFLSCTSLSSVDFPNVEKTGVRCFGDCPSLISANLPKLSSAGQQLFENCINLSSASLESLENAGSSAFSNCRALISVYIPNAKIIGNNAFEGCSSIVSLDLPNAQKFGYETFIDNLQLTSLYCPKLSLFETGMVSNSGAIIRSRNSFRGASHLLSVYVNNDKMHSIGNGYGERDQLIVDDSESCILYGVGGISKLTNDTVKKIGDGAFVHGRSISSINCSNLLSIGDYAFYGATVSSIDMTNVSYIGYGSFYRGNGPKNIYSLSVKNILLHTFEENNGIESIDLPMVSSIDHNMVFMNSTGLKSVHLSSVKDLPNRTFSHCSQLASISCENLSSISYYVFSNCTELTSIYFPHLKKFINPGSYTVYATFISCASLKTANLSSIEEIESYCGRDGVFENCKSLEYVNLANINNIQDHMFRYCSSLSTITALSALYIGKYSFKNCSNLTGFDSECFSLVSSIGEYAFDECSNLISLLLPSVIKIEGYSFKNAGLSSGSTIEFPNLSTINSNAFHSSNFENIRCPNLLSLGSLSFMNCKNLISCTLPFIDFIPFQSFSNCKSLISIDMPNVAFIDYKAFQNCSSLISVEFLNLSSIGAYSSLDYYGAFHNCSSLMNVNIPNCLSICGRDFYNCVNLSSINVPNLRHVVQYAFNNCTSLSSVDLPEVTTIEKYAFNNCTSLSSFILSANQNVPNVQTNIFTGITHKISAYIPEGMTESYRADANWAWLENKLCVDFIECQQPQ